MSAKSGGAQPMSAAATTDRIARWRANALKAMVGSGVAVAVGAALDTQAFLQSWIWSYVYVIGLPLGCLGLGLLTQVVSGGWGTAARPVLSSSARTLPYMALLFLPIAAGMHDLYPWAHPGAMDHDPLLAHKAAWLNDTGFLLRTVLYFALWLLGVRAMDHGTKKSRLNKLAAPLLLLYALSMTFASIDWAMSLEPHWYSTMYGAIEIVGQGISAFCVCVLFVGLLYDSAPFNEEIDLSRFHDIGKMLFAFIFLWFYTGFSQLLIIWGGNLAEEAPWYLRRSSHGWEIVAQLLVVTHFVLPFGILLSKQIKRDVKLMIRITAGMLVVRALGEFFLIAPAFHEHVHVHWLDLATPVFMFSFWLFLFSRNLGRGLVAEEAAA